jgi:hypothetical protein
MVVVLNAPMTGDDMTFLIRMALSVPLACPDAAAGVSADHHGPFGCKPH